MIYAASNIIFLKKTAKKLCEKDVDLSDNFPDLF
jgi:hypothetical protein